MIPADAYFTIEDNLVFQVVKLILSFHSETAIVCFHELSAVMAHVHVQTGFRWSMVQIHVSFCDSVFIHHSTEVCFAPLSSFFVSFVDLVQVTVA